MAFLMTSKLFQHYMVSDMSMKGEHFVIF